EPLFYLRSRGLSEGQARMLLLEAFIAEVIVKIDNETLEQDVAEKAKTWLSNALS
ncbi:MAG TPA: Fe-S cluster assembly protein SufD, partial [Rhodospirillaceae bacterium]|nr:Fe-S cluster assembly protein SufD [Rhodospirillaceae bacterium]